MTTHFKTVDEYIASFQGATRERLEVLRKLVQEAMPQAEERISYNVPAYFIGGQHVVYFAGFAKHISMYPGRTNSTAFNELAAQYAHGKSTVRFSNAEQLPVPIIKQFLATRLQEALEKS